MNRPLTPTEECSLTHERTSKGYIECVNSKLKNPYTIGYEEIKVSPPSNIIMIISIAFAAMVIGGVIYFYSTKK